jgi:hypothetical protein
MFERPTWQYLLAGESFVRSRASRIVSARPPNSRANHTPDCSARNEEWHGLWDLVFHVDERVFFQRDAPVGLPQGIDAIRSLLTPDSVVR